METDSFSSYFGQKVDFDFTDGPITFSDEEEEAIKKHPERLDLYCGRGSKIELFDEVANGEGGEGTVYNCSFSGFVVKLYNKEFRKISKQKKIQLLIDNNPGSKRLCWPLDTVLYHGKFIGFLMPFVSGKKLDALERNPKKVMSRFPKYTKEKQIDMIIEILEEVELLHSKTILLGDINTRNIMFDNQGDMGITFVDIDSVQIGQFPCITSSPGYDAPEVIVFRAMKDGTVDEAVAKEKSKEGQYLFNNYYQNFYRTPENEYHALAVLLFRMMTCGASPYDCYDYEFADPDLINENDEDLHLCICHAFPYSSLEGKTKGTCRNKEIWSHMPSFIKEAFVNTFTGKGRLAPKEWITLFEYYKKLLNEGKIQDAEAHLAFADNEIDYSKVYFSLTQSHTEKGFLMRQAVDGVIKQFKDAELNQHLKEVTEALKHQPIYSVGKYNFTLIYNIGILKKVKAESSL